MVAELVADNFKFLIFLVIVILIAKNLLSQEDKIKVCATYQIIVKAIVVM